MNEDLFMGTAKPPLFPSAPQLLADTEIGENLGLGFVDCEQVVTCSAILRESLAFLRDVITIVATEASGIAHVPDVIRMGSPGDLHVRE